MARQQASIIDEPFIRGRGEGKSSDSGREEENDIPGAGRGASVYERGRGADPRCGAEHCTLRARKGVGRVETARKN